VTIPLGPFSSGDSLVDVLRARAARDPDQPAYIFLKDGITPDGDLSYGELDRRARGVAAFLSRTFRPQDRLLLMYPPGLEFVIAFWGCLYSGMIAIPVPAPDVFRMKQSAGRLSAVRRDAEAAGVLTVNDTISLCREARYNGLMGDPDQWIATDRLDRPSPETWKPPRIDSSDLAYLQYTSGSTASPKGAMVSHENLTHHCRCITIAGDYHERAVTLSWMPHYHDYGLVKGILHPISIGRPAFLMSAVTFLKRPLRWLQAIQRHLVTHSGGPNFAYRHCVAMTTPEQRSQLDLSAWQVASCGAEPIFQETIEQFIEAFASAGFKAQAFYPAYGMAEYTLLSSLKRPGDVPRILSLDAHALERGMVRVAAGEGRAHREMVSCGHPVGDTVVAIVDPQTGVQRKSDEIGEIWLAGQSVTQGYWNRPEETRATFQAVIKDTDQGPFLRTGDLGFIRDGELYVTGRLKDLIIIRGRNHYPQDIERSVQQCHPAFNAGSGVAFSVEEESEESLILVQEVEQQHEHTDAEMLADSIRRTVADHHDLEAAAILLVKPGTIPKTSSGKVQRNACKQAYRAGSLPYLSLHRPATPAPHSLPHALSVADLLALPETGRMLRLQSYLRGIIAALLGRDEHRVASEPLNRLGIDSLKAYRLLHRIETTFGAVLPLSSVLGGSGITELAGDVLARMTEPQAAYPDDSAESSEPKGLPLSYNQRALWLHHELEPESAAANVAALLPIAVDMVPEILHAALVELGRRHQILRTTYEAGLHGARAVIHQALPPGWGITDAADWNWTDVQRHAVTAAEAPFDLRRGPLWRTVLFRGRNWNILLFVAHHIAIDGTSMTLLVQELRRLYQTMRTQTQEGASPAPVPYRSFITWQGDMLAGASGEKLAAYWNGQLAGEWPGYDLLYDRAAPSSPACRYAWHSFSLEASVTRRLREAASAAGVTLYCLLLSAFQILLHRYTGETDILVGSPVSGRSRPRFAATIGDCVNIVLLRQSVKPDMTVQSLIEQTQQIILDALEHQDYPLALAIQDRQPNGGPMQPAPLPVLFALQQFRLLPDADGDLTCDGAFPISPDGFGTDYYVIPQQGGRFPLSLEMSESDRGVSGCFEYDAGLFSADTMTRLQSHYCRIVEQMLEASSGPIAGIPLMTDAEQQRLLKEFNYSSTLTAPGTSLPRQFAEWAEQTPDAAAVVDGERQMSYRELNRRANSLAQYLRRRGVGQEVVVGICLERSIDLIIALLAVLKAGGAYLPLDPEYPTKRMEQMLADMEIRALLTHTTLLSRLPSAHPHTICLDSEWPAVARLSGEAPSEDRDSYHLAYVLYTSGTSGRPKGVMVEDRSLANYASAFTRHIELKPCDRVLQFASIGFDAAAEEIFPCLTSGATLVLRNASMMDSMGQLLEHCRRWEITVLDLPTALWHELVARMEADRLALPPSVRIVVIGGERVLPQAVARWGRMVESRVRLVNTYGPTETTIVATIGDLSPSDRADSLQEISIGRPVPGAEVYVLDANLRPVPIGVTGELCISGVGLARGYAGKPDLTAAKFPSVTLTTGVATRLYRTGDYARWRGDGSLEYRGRMDRQVKIRGYRIELEEIESVLGSHPDILQAAVEVREDMPGDKRLVAFIVPRAGSSLSAGRLMQDLRHSLPHYMTPSAFVELPSLPRTAHGKLDRRALRVARDSRASRFDVKSVYVPPRNGTEELLSQIWGEILHVRDIGIHDNFFELGGNSLLATQVVSRVRLLVKRDVPLRAFFENPTIAHLSSMIGLAAEPVDQTAVPPMVRADRTVPLSLSFAQERMWFLYQVAPGSSAYNIPASVRLHGPLNKAALRLSVEELVRRHESLRTTFADVAGRPVQIIHSTLDPVWTEQDLCSLPRDEREQAASELATAEARRPFDLRTGPLLRVLLLQLDEEHHVVILTTHHIISDQWSYGIVARELVSRYNAHCDGTIRAVEPIPELQYVDFAQWQREWLSGPVLDEQLAFWTHRLRKLTTLELPSDRPRPAKHSFEGDHVSLDLPWSLVQQLKQAAVAEGVTLYMVFLAGFFALLHRVTGQRDVVIGTPIANRNWLPTEDMIGTFVNTLVLRCDLSGDPDFRRLLARVRDVSLDAYAHQDLPFEKLVETLQPDRGQGGLPMVQVLFNFANTPFARTDFKHLSWLPYEIRRGAAQFDLTLSIDPTASRMAYLEFNTDLFDRRTTERWLGHYLTLLEAMIANPGQPISGLPLLQDSERRLILEDWNATETKFGEMVTVSQLFEAQVARAPEKVAVTDEQGTLSYAELNTRANRFAHYLQMLGVGPEVVVAIHMDHSSELLVCLLGILKAGGAYLPLVPGLPAKRMSVMLETGQVRYVVTTSVLVKALPPQEIRVVLFDQEWDAISKLSRDNPVQKAGATSLAYVLFTSGSTGLPKGVEIEHRGLTNCLQSMRRRPGIAEQDLLLSVTPLSFDIAGLELYLPLIAGASILLASRPQAVDGTWLAGQLDEGGATIMQATPATWRMVALAGWRGTRKITVLCGGETLSVDLAQTLTSRAAAVWNVYGPTETTIWSTIERVQPEPGRAIPLGRPLANTQLYVLDANLEPVPIGIPGELYIGGSGVARGYRNNPQLTSERFIASPFQEKGRLYRTGDQVKWLPDGRLEFIGRIDFQVKIRGFRIEPGEVEIVLGLSPNVSQAVVTVREDDGERRLVAYVTLKAAGSFDANEMRRWLRDRLPDYMIPSVIVPLESFPLTDNGKIDRRNLPPPSEARTIMPAETTPPRDALELQLAALWKQVLGKDAIGVRDNFFDLGGHSLLALRIFSAIERVFRKRLPLALLFQAPTIERLAEVLRDEGCSVPWRSLVAIQAHGGRRPFFVVPGVGGNVLVFARLSKLLGEDLPFYGLQAHGLDGKARPFTRIADMARHYIDEIRTVQPRGPYRIGGTCTGGLVAYEMAQQLTAGGEDVDLAIIESWHPDSYRAHWRRPPLVLWPMVFVAGKLATYLRLLKSRPFHEWPKYGREKFHSLWQMAHEADERSEGQQVLYRDYVTYATFHAAARYVFKTYRGRVLNVIASRRSLSEATRDTRLVFAAEAAPGSRTVTVAAEDSGRLFMPPHVQELAGYLEAFWSLEGCPDAAKPASSSNQSSEAA
jgi:amino acid adenylation domain-containing protein